MKLCVYIHRTNARRIYCYYVCFVYVNIVKRYHNNQLLALIEINLKQKDKYIFICYVSGQSSILTCHFYYDFNHDRINTYDDLLLQIYYKHIEESVQKFTNSLDIVILL